jgi:hypothetical protein
LALIVAALGLVALAPCALVTIGFSSPFLPIYELGGAPVVARIEARLLGDGLSPTAARALAEGRLRATGWERSLTFGQMRSRAGSLRVCRPWDPWGPHSALLWAERRVVAMWTALAPGESPRTEPLLAAELDVASACRRFKDGLLCEAERSAVWWDDRGGHEVFFPAPSGWLDWKDLRAVDLSPVGRGGCVSLDELATAPL